MTGFAGEQIDLSVLSLDSGRLSASDAYSRAFGMIGTTQVVGDVASHIEHFAGYDNFLRARYTAAAAVRPFHQQHCDTGRDENGCSKLTNARPTARKRDWPPARNLLGQPKRWFNSAKLRPDRIVRLGLLSQPLAKIGIGFSVVQRRTKLRIRIVDRS